MRSLIPDPGTRWFLSSTHQGCGHRRSMPSCTPSGYGERPRMGRYWPQKGSRRSAIRSDLGVGRRSDQFLNLRRYSARPAVFLLPILPRNIAGSPHRISEAESLHSAICPGSLHAFHLSHFLRSQSWPAGERTSFHLRRSLQRRERKKTPSKYSSSILLFLNVNRQRLIIKRPELFHSPCLLS